MVKNLALMTHITTELDEYPLIRLARNSGMRDINVIGGDALNDGNNYIVFLNGKTNRTVQYRIVIYVYFR